MEPRIRHTQSAGLYDFRSFQPNYEVPETSPSYRSVIARAESLALDKHINSKEYNSALRVIIPDEEDWTRLCEFSDYMFDNVADIDKQPHKTTCKQLLSHNPRMYSWLCHTAKLESKKTSDVAFQYKALSLDWSRSYFRKNLYTKILGTSFDWRKVIASDELVTKTSDELVTKTSEKKHQVPVRRMHTLITDKLQRKSIVAKSLNDLCSCLEKKPSYKHYKELSTFISKMRLFIKVTRFSPAKVNDSTISWGVKLSEEVNLLMITGRKSDKKDFRNFKNILDGYIRILKE